VKFFDLFGKPSPQHLKHVRPATGKRSDEQQATVRKIDAIESEIVAEFEAQAHPDIGSHGATHIEQQLAEAGILHASRQGRAAEALLLDAVARPTGDAQENLAWMMLLELATCDRDKVRFDELSLRYAERFETSPPQWRAPLADTPTAAVPLLAFRGKLLASSGPALAQLEQMARSSSIFSIDLSGVSDLDSKGCEALLTLLRQWDHQHKQVSITPSPSMLALLRGLVQDGAPPATDAAWRLLLELLRISGDTRAYEDACIDYSIAFEQSPPGSLGLMAANSSDHPNLCLPEEIMAPVDALIDSLRAAFDASDSIVLDCSRLQRIEFHAAAALLDGIAGLAQGKPVKWHEVSYLVATLLTLVGGDGKLTIRHRQL
jgi:ABC-type transporter Mla MlaB component